MMVRLPYAVWCDTIDPRCSSLQAELGLPAPTFKKVGRGQQVVYEDVTEEVVAQLRTCLLDIAECRTGGEDEEQMAYRITDAVHRMTRTKTR